VIRVYDVAGNVIETHQHKAEFKSSADAIPAFYLITKVDAGWGLWVSG
jgi:hypothetical protein